MAFFACHPPTDAYNLNITYASGGTLRTTLDLDETLVRQALAATGLPTKTALIEEGLRSLLRRQAGRALASLGGSMPAAKVVRRRRSA